MNLRLFPAACSKLILASAFSFALSLNAQESGSSNTYTPKTPRQARNVSQDSTASVSALTPDDRESSPLRLGPVLFRPGIHYTYTDAENLLRSPDNPVDSEIQTISLDLNFDYQDKWSFNYRPSWIYYSSSRFVDSDSHTANFTTAFSLQDWRMGFSQSWQDSNSSLIETGNQTQQHVWGTTLNASRQLNSTLYADLSVDQDLRFTDSYTDVQERSASAWLRRQSSEAVDVSLGFTYGYADIDPGYNTEYIQTLIRIGFQPTEKLSLGLDGGVDFREIDGPGFEDEESPIYNATIQYRPFTHTTLGLNVSRQIGASYYSNYNNDRESITLSLRQRLLQRLHLTVSYSENSSDYLSFLNGFATTRSDDYDSFTVDLSTVLRKKISLSLFYRNNQNQSSSNQYGFSSDQTGIRIGYRY